MAYTEPTATDLQARYVAFASASPDTITYWLTDAHRYVDQTWSEEDYGPALMAVAAHWMVVNGVLATTDTGAIQQLAQGGVTDFQSGGRQGFRASLSPDAVKQAISGTWSATQYGQEYERLLNRNKRGAVVATDTAIPTDDCGTLGWPGVYPSDGGPWGW